MKAKEFLLAIDPLRAQTTVQLFVMGYEAFLEEITLLRGILSLAEQERAAKFVFPEHKERYIIAHGVLRLILAHYTQRAPHSLTFAIAAKGKPYFADQTLKTWHFNLSHTKTGIAIAISYKCPVGIDIEWVNPDRGLLELAQRFFAPSEAQLLIKLPMRERISSFYRLWTCKEAFLKATGEGIAEGLNRWVFDISKGGQVALMTTSNQESTDCWSFCHRYLPKLEAMVTAVTLTAHSKYDWQPLSI